MSGKGVLIDFRQIQDISEGEFEFEASIIAMYLEDTQQRIEQLPELLEHCEFEKIKRQAHTLKGASGSLGVEVLREASLQLEHAAAGGNQELCDKLIHSILEQFVLVNDQFNQYLAEHSE
jgi:HPt (histidine-containing phosphotransfer) domain-containing protein